MHVLLFTHTDIASVMPSDSVYITILRDPVTMYESLFTYSNFAIGYGINGKDGLDNLGQFIDNAQVHYDQIESVISVKGHVKNPMLYDFGLPIDVIDDEESIDELIELIDKQFDLVMMTEYIHESLVLLKEHLCWTLEDIVFFHLNSRTKSPKASNINQDLATKIRTWNSGDVKLYNHFNKTFWRKVESYGFKQMERHVKILKNYNKFLYDQCVDDVINDPNVWHPKNVKINTLKVKESMVNNTMCVAMTRPELIYTEHLRRQHLDKFDNLRTKK